MHVDWGGRKVLFRDDYKKHRNLGSGDCVAYANGCKRKKDPAAETGFVWRSVPVAGIVECHKTPRRCICEYRFRRPCLVDSRRRRWIFRGDASRRRRGRDALGRGRPRQNFDDQERANTAHKELLKAR